MTQFTYCRWRKEFSAQKADAGKADPKRVCLWKSPARRRLCVDHVTAKFTVSERSA
ncbi:hypothetical protein CES86_1748 [Brucella lupini]|uniref:Uncharacterized protein n=1 Tax=Brucella lupini TaxID=255457 RepID=A0A256GTA1_9HYPH|nr:hypothetical protein CES86_1748 [Brucella lupini]